MKAPLDAVADELACARLELRRAQGHLEAAERALGCSVASDAPASSPLQSVVETPVAAGAPMASETEAPQAPEVPEASAAPDAATPADAPVDRPLYTLGEEIANSVTHGIGVLLGIAGLVLLIVKAVSGGALPTHVASAIVFGCTLILEYLASTLYHAIAAPRAKRIFRIIDHSSIYLLIAGSYTPFCLITLADVGGIPMFVVVWALAFAGISFEVIGRQRQPRWVSILIYLAMGWLVVFRLRELVAALDPVALALLVVGGLCYTIGTIFYLLKKIRYMHSVWHLWVLAGSIFIFMAVILYVI